MRGRAQWFGVRAAAAGPRAGARAGGGLDTLCQLQPEGRLLFQGQVSPLRPQVQPPVEMSVGGGHPTRDQSERPSLFHVRDALSHLGPSPVLLFPPAPSQHHSRPQHPAVGKILFLCLDGFGVSVTDTSSRGAPTWFPPEVSYDPHVTGNRRAGSSAIRFSPGLLRSPSETSPRGATREAGQKPALEGALPRRLSVLPFPVLAVWPSVDCGT